METKKHAFAVGLFVLVGILGLTGSVVWLSQHKIGEATYEVRFTEPVAGLANGTLVRYNGIDVGHVVTVDLDNNNPKGVIALLAVRPDLSIRTDSVAFVDNAGLTGESYVEIDGGNPGKPPLARENGNPYPVIPSGLSPFQQIKRETPKVLSSFKKVAGRTSDLLNDHNQREIADILKNLATASERLNQLLASTDATTKVISETAKTFGKTGEDIGSAATESKLQIKQSAAQIDQAFAAATLAAKRFDQLSMDVDRMVTSSEGQLTAGVGQLNQLLAQARSMVQKVSRLADDVQRQPTELLFGDRREGYVPK